MGVKSTIELTRAEADERYVELRIRQLRRGLMADAVKQTDRELEDSLERLNDEAEGGEGFENYSIRNKGGR